MAIRYGADEFIIRFFDKEEAIIAINKIVESL